jgi:hypothetical protein
MNPGLMISPKCLQENDILISPYFEEEIRKAVFKMEHNKAPGPDGFPAEFYQTFWDIFKFYSLDLFPELHEVQLDLFRINFGEIILLRKLIMWNGFSNTDQYAY